MMQNETFYAENGINIQTEKEEKRMTVHFKTAIMRALNWQSIILRK